MLHQMLLSRLIAAASALIFSVLSFVAPPQRRGRGTVVRVGLCFGETAKRRRHGARVGRLLRSDAPKRRLDGAADDRMRDDCRLTPTRASGDGQFALQERFGRGRSRRAERRDGAIRKRGLRRGGRAVPRRRGSRCSSWRTKAGSRCSCTSARKRSRSQPARQSNFPADETRCTATAGRVECIPRRDALHSRQRRRAGGRQGRAAVGNRGERGDETTKPSPC